MSTQTVLVIDDSSTIRKMVDSHLTQAGYRVVLAPTAEKGLELAPELVPDIILLDHQLPGTTGIEVCKKIIAMPECRAIPFVVSSTLRKQAYVEYMDVPNVVDSLPKPFKPELLKITIANALEVGAMIVSSQSDGTAVPEVVDEVADSSLSGDFGWVSLREVLDFLNNGNKQGVLEVELAQDRVWFYLDQGRIQAVVSASVTPETVAEKLPESLKELAPVLKFTMSSGFNSQVDGFVELLDRKVLDPRLLRTLLRFQAAYLTWQCFQTKPISFTFSASRQLPALFRRTPLQSSLAGILVEGSMSCADQEVNQLAETHGWVRKGLRGQNLDRSGLSAKQLQLLTNLGTEPVATEILADKVDMSVEATYHCLEGFRLAEWVDLETIESGNNLVALESDPEGSTLLRELITSTTNSWAGKVVRDEFGLQLLINRKAADYLLVEVSGEEELRLPKCLEGKVEELMASTPIGIIAPEKENCPPLAAELSDLLVIHRPYTYDDVLETINLLPESKTQLGEEEKQDISELLSVGE